MLRASSLSAAFYGLDCATALYLRHTFGRSLKIALQLSVQPKLVDFSCFPFTTGRHIKVSEIAKAKCGMHSET